MRTLVLVLGCSLVFGCGGSEPPAQAPETTAEPAPPQAQDAVTLTITEANVENGRLHLQGTTSLPDGAILNYRVEHDGFESGDFDGQLLGALTVSGGAFEADLDVDGWPMGHAYTWISFQMTPGGGADQPAAIVDMYGERGEELTGPDVVEIGDAKKVEVRTDVEIP